MDSNEVTILLDEARSGRGDAPSRVWAALQTELQSIAAKSADGPLDERTVSDSTLLDAAYRDLFGGPIPEWRNRGEFLDAVARSMADFLRKRHRERTLGGEANPRDLTGTAGELTEFTQADSDESIQALDIVDEIGRESPETARVARLRFILGLDNKQTARALGLDDRTAELKWRFSQAMIRKGLNRGISE